MDMKSLIWLPSIQRLYRRDRSFQRWTIWREQSNQWLLYARSTSTTVAHTKWPLQQGYPLSTISPWLKKNNCLSAVKSAVILHKLFLNACEPWAVRCVTGKACTLYTACSSRGFHTRSMSATYIPHQENTFVWCHSATTHYTSVSEQEWNQGGGGGRHGMGIIVISAKHQPGFLFYR